MLIMVSGATSTLKEMADDDRFGVLVVPDAKNNPEALPLHPGRWAMDNGAYSGLNKPAFINMLQRHQGYPGCRWVSAPDVVGDADATLGQWPFWSRLIRGVGFPPALVAQDGLTVAMTPWSEIACLFIGGTTAWKWSEAARELLAYASARGIDTHIGRVNSRMSYREAERRGANSIDGTSRSMFPKVQMAKDVRWMDEWTRQPALSL
jgi:hypothetical protein